MASATKSSKIKIFIGQMRKPLCSVVLDYKMAKLGLGQDWNTVRAKYEDIKDNFVPSNPDKDDNISRCST